jgi:primosomal protein N' (replication factor Y) (superfamily II helicase)
MYITVRLLNGFKKPLTYALPDAFRGKSLQGRIVQVPLRNRLVHALVQAQFKEFAIKPAFEIKELKNLQPFPDDAHYVPFITKIARFQQIEPFLILQRLQNFLISEKKDEDFIQHKKQLKQDDVTLTDEQKKVVDFLDPFIRKQSFKPTLLHGVTSSGKTEVYKKLLSKTYHENKSSIVLLPEVTLALQFAHLFQQTLSVPVFSFHSHNTKKEKDHLWNMLLNHKPVVIVGVHLPVMLPINKLGLIIVDEEHEIGYQEKKHPKINTKEAALIRAHHYQIPILLGSATPSFSSLYNVKKRNWAFFSLKKRFAGNFPTIKTVCLTDKKNHRKNFWVSKELEHAIKERLIKKEQTIIFLNRRGICFFIQCKNCSYIPTCKRCSVSMTLHNYNELHCHYCGKIEQVPTTCPTCKKEDFLKKGIGTQQVVAMLEKIFPHAKISRADLETASKKKQWHQTVQEFNEGNIDILVGTQTITKGYHFPGVTLVGILWADLNLHFPVYHAAETTLQQLIQVAGRAGRESKESLVIAQTMNNHLIFSFLNEVDYLTFYEQEINKRETLSYPPIGRFSEIELIHSQESVVEKEAQKMVSLLSKHPSIQVFGPSLPPVAKIKNKHRRKIYIKASSFTLINEAYQLIKKYTFSSSHYFTPTAL